MDAPGYNVYSKWLRDYYGEKVYKLPVNIPVSCPNRDGTIGYGGCIYCGGKGGGNETLSDTISVTDQLAKNKAYMGKRYHAKRFIPFFQSFTNTYGPLGEFKQAVLDACQGEDIVAIAIATRPDCLLPEHLSFLERVKADRGIDVDLELGLQTANDHTLKIIGRGHRLGDYVDAARRIKDHGLRLCTHVILDLPWDDEEDVITTAEVLSGVGSDFVKCHSLYVEKGTVLGKMYHNGEVALLNQDDYIRRCILFLTHLSPRLVIERIIGRAPADDSIITNWHTSWWRVRDCLHQEMAESGYYQGQKYQEKAQRIHERIALLS